MIRTPHDSQCRKTNDNILDKRTVFYKLSACCDVLSKNFRRAHRTLHNFAGFGYRRHGPFYQIHNIDLMIKKMGSPV
jgi:hypothetical protein